MSLLININKAAGRGSERERLQTIYKQIVIDRFKFEAFDRHYKDFGEDAFVMNNIAGEATQIENNARRTINDLFAIEPPTTVSAVTPTTKNNSDLWKDILYGLYGAAGIYTGSKAWQAVRRFRQVQAPQQPAIEDDSVVQLDGDIPPNLSGEFPEEYKKRIIDTAKLMGNSKDALAKRDLGKLFKDYAIPFAAFLGGTVLGPAYYAGKGIIGTGASILHSIVGGGSTAAITYAPVLTDEYKSPQSIAGYPVNQEAQIQAIVDKANDSYSAHVDRDSFDRANLPMSSNIQSDFVSGDSLLTQSQAGLYVSSLQRNPRFRGLIERITHHNPLAYQTLTNGGLTKTQILNAVSNQGRVEESKELPFGSVNPDEYKIPIEEVKQPVKKKNKVIKNAEKRVEAAANYKRIEEEIKQHTLMEDAKANKSDKKYRKARSDKGKPRGMYAKVKIHKPIKESAPVSENARVRELELQYADNEDDAYSLQAIASELRDMTSPQAQSLRELVVRRHTQLTGGKLKRKKRVSKKGK